MIVVEIFYSPEDDPNEDEDADFNVVEIAAVVIEKRQKQAVKVKLRVRSIFRLKEPEDEQELTMYIETIPKVMVNVFNLTVRFVSCSMLFIME